MNIVDVVNAYKQKRAHFALDFSNNFLYKGMSF